MPFKIVGISGSPVKKGNTDTFLSTIMDHAAEKGLDTDIVNLSELTIKNCIHCNFCLAKQKTDKYCSLKDDAQAVFEKVESADIRFRNIDSMGHVNNAVYLTYFEEGRKEFLRLLFGIESPEDCNFILANISCDYLKPIKINDMISLKIWIGKIGQKSFKFNYSLVGKEDKNDETTIYAKGQSIQVFFDYQKNIALPVPVNFREKISEYVCWETG